MKILGKFKDYYDFISSIEGIDEHVIFNRNGAKVINNIFTYGDFASYFASSLFTELNNEYNADKTPNYVLGILEVGYIKYVILCEREVNIKYLTPFKTKTNNKVKLTVVKKFCDYTKIDTDSNGKLNVLPIQLFSIDQLVLNYNYKFYIKKILDIEYEGIFRTIEIIKRLNSIHEIKSYIKRTDDEILIFKNTQIGSIISPIEFYMNIYNYLLSIKNIDIEDNRSDIDKIQAAGFDKKISFRK